VRVYANADLSLPRSRGRAGVGAVSAASVFAPIPAFPRKRGKELASEWGKEVWFVRGKELWFGRGKGLWIERG